MKHDTIITHPTTTPDLWVVATPVEDGAQGGVRPLLTITRWAETDGVWHVGTSEVGFADIREAFADAVHRIIPLEEPPPVLSGTCPACGRDVQYVSDHGFVWHASSNKVAAPLVSVIESMAVHAAVCPMQVDEIAIGWLAAAGWSGCEDEVDRREGPFTEDAHRVALRDVYAFLEATDPDDIEAFLRAVVPVTEQYGDGGPHEYLGHDIWLTQNHHGAGFWDRDWLPEGVGERLTEAAQSTLHERYVWVSGAGEVDIE